MGDAVWLRAERELATELAPSRPLTEEAPAGELGRNPLW